MQPITILWQTLFWTLLNPFLAAPVDDVPEKGMCNSSFAPRLCQQLRSIHMRSLLFSRTRAWKDVLRDNIPDLSRNAAQCNEFMSSRVIQRYAAWISTLHKDVTSHVTNADVWSTLQALITFVTLMTPACSARRALSRTSLTSNSEMFCATSSSQPTVKILTWLHLTYTHTTTLFAILSWNGEKIIMLGPDIHHATLSWVDKFPVFRRCLQIVVVLGDEVNRWFDLSCWWTQPPRSSARQCPRMHTLTSFCARHRRLRWVRVHVSCCWSKRIRMSLCRLFGRPCLRCHRRHKLSWVLEAKWRGVSESWPVSRDVVSGWPVMHVSTLRKLMKWSALRVTPAGRSKVRSRSLWWIGSCSLIRWLERGWTSSDVLSGELQMIRAHFVPRLN